ncbi:hypothetical protein ESA94_19305 [Lacibacter luteus]|uniref:DUF5777 domain-containing protein n=2 Tax=Lacibacter luteus TaxID=2508719 RepID=A0A4Q1CES4_9BACT|nr:hypothetical protein ESA94_19305 [Lacibacter luteus]
MFFLLSMLLYSIAGAAQETEDLLKLVEKEKPKKEYVKYAFKSPRVINGHSMEFLAPGTMDFRILHRFGQVNEGFKNFFGLDQASMRMGFDFGLYRNLMVGVGRSTFRKELDAFAKYAPIMQSTGTKNSPVTVALAAGITMHTEPWADPSANNHFSSRLGYYYQVIVGRKFSEALSLQLTPTMVHTNLVPVSTQPNDVFAMGLGGRVKITNRIALTADYYYLFNGREKDFNYNPLSVGIDIETGGHVFQLHFSNATGMNERAFITETYNTWGKGEIRFGFNLSRIFQIKKQKQSM